MNMKLKRIAVALVASLMIPIAVTSAPVAHADPPLILSVTTADTHTVQQALSDFGYTIAVDGFYGPQTMSAVRHWQRVNGLFVDGVAGPITLPTLRPAAGTRTQTQTATPPPAPAPDLTPTDFDCESWRPLFEKYDLPFSQFLPTMQRESRCSNARNYNANTRDDSYGPLQINLWGGLAAVFERNGISRSYIETPEGAVHATAKLYFACGSMGPWIKPYSCPNGGLR